MGNTRRIRLRSVKRYKSGVLPELLNAMDDDKRGDNVYDFGGVPFYRDKTRREYGIYRFKKGYGGEVVSCEGQFVKVYRPLLEKAAVIFSELSR